MNQEDIKQYINDTINIKVKPFVKEILNQNEILPKSIKQRHIEDMVIKRGLSADRPTDGGAVRVYAYFATDTDILSIWNGSAWVSETLT